MSRVKVAVVGHVEWVEFAAVERLPTRGEIVHAEETWQQAGGGGGVAAVQLRTLAERATLFTALGADELGRVAREDLVSRGVRVEAGTADSPQRRAFTHVDRGGERTITTIGKRAGASGLDRSLPWDELDACAGVYFCAGDRAALEAARRARVLVVSARELALLRNSGVRADAVVGSGNDPAESYSIEELDPRPSLAVMTDGARGGWAQPGGPFPGGTPPERIVDAYGAGDCFAAGLTFALAAGMEQRHALAFAAQCGAGALGGRGVHAERVTPEAVVDG